MEWNGESIEERGGEVQEEKPLWRYFAVNGITKEVQEGWPGQKQRGKWPRRVQLFQKAIGQLSRDPAIRGESWRVLGYLMEVLDWDNWLVVPQQQIEAALGMKQPQVSRAVKQLRDKGILVQAAAPAPKTTYRLSAEFAYRGAYAGWQKRRREEQAAQARKGAGDGPV